MIESIAKLSIVSGQFSTNRMFQNKLLTDLQQISYSGAFVLSLTKVTFEVNGKRTGTRILKLYHS